MGLFSKPPPRTSISENIEWVTNPEHSEEDWTIIFQIVEVVKSSAEGPREAAKAIRRRLNTGNGKATGFTITVWQALVENCGNNFLIQMTRPHFIEDITRCYSESSDENRDRILKLLYECKALCKDDAEFHPILQLYSQLSHSRGPYARHHTGTINPEVVEDTARVMSAEAMRNDIQSTRANVQVLSESLGFVAPGEDITKNEVIQEFYAKCKDNHGQIMQYIQECSDEKDMQELLELNQDLLNVFRMYDEIIENGFVDAALALSRTRAPTDSAAPTTTTTTSANPGSAPAGAGKQGLSDVSLIYFGGSEWTTPSNSSDAARGAPSATASSMSTNPFANPAARPAPDPFSDDNAILDEFDPLRTRK
ncbi:uncharacterized protein VTP21DRAFT_7617 [Calcarisporiella thermophila]|uniref:uncharacterized protein n=1 Tax=Calcarisporiella thermophila TaxID=911321 RepID=UPI0037449FB7